MKRNCIISLKKNIPFSDSIYFQSFCQKLDILKVGHFEIIFITEQHSMKYLNWENNYICQRLNCSTSIEIKSNDSLSNKGGRRKVKNNQHVGNMGKKNSKVIFP